MNPLNPLGPAMPSPNLSLEPTPKPVNQAPPNQKPPVNTEPPANPEPPSNPESPVKPTPPAKPKPPTASFNYAPKEPVAGQPVLFNASSSSCPDGACTYEWSDDGSPVELSSPLWPLGVGKTLTYTFSEADTKYVRLMVTEGSSGQASTVVHDVVVEESEPEPPPTEPPPTETTPTEPPPTETTPAEPPPPAPPKNTALPSLSGSAVEGQTLSATKGTWTGSPTSYAYQWENCNSSGASCSNVSGATAASYKLLAEDVGLTMRVVVKASNAGGSTSASSAATATVTSAAANPGNPGEPSLSAKGCFDNTETEGTSRIEACGYPGEHNTGVEKSALEKGLAEAAGTIRLTGEEHYEDKRLNGSIIVAWNAKNVVIKNDEITSNGLCSSTPPYSIANGCTGNAIEFERESDSNDEAAKGTVISHVKVGGTEIKGPNTIQTCVDARWNSPYVAEYVNTEDCSGFKLNAGGELNHVYCPSNYEIEEEHYECVTDEGESLAKTPLVVKDSTIFTPQTTTITAALFLQGLYGPIQEVRLEDNLMAGGNYIIDGGEEAGHDKLVGPLVVTGNRFARCLSSSCPDSHGFWEEGGQYKVQAFTNEALTTWTHNFWDDNLEECVYGVGACY